MDDSIFEMQVARAMHRIEDLYNRTAGQCFLSFSGGKDSTIVLQLVKLCEELGTIPKNAIPAVFCDTKIELGATVEFVKWVQAGWYGNVQIIQTEMLFPHVLKKHGKPILSKMKSELLRRYQKDSKMKSAQMLFSNGYTTRLANKHMHILHPDFDIKISNACCEEMKKKPFKRYIKAHGIRGYMTGERQAEGGARALSFAKRGGNICTKINTAGLIIKNPIVDWDEEMCGEFVRRYAVPLSRAYTDYGLQRTGCFCCPFARDIEKNLDVLRQYEPNRYKAALFYLSDVYIAQGVQLPLDADYMTKYAEKWAEYDTMRREMLEKHRPGCQLLTCGRTKEGDPCDS